MYNIVNTLLTRGVKFIVMGVSIMTANLDKYSDYDILCLMDYAFSEMKAQDVLVYADRLMNRGSYMFEAAFKSGVSEYYLGNFQKARELFEKAFEYQRDDSRQKRIFRAVSVRPLKMRADHYGRLFRFAKRLFEEQCYEDALELIRILIEMDKNNPAYYRFAGTVCIRLNEFKAANEYFSAVQDCFSVNIM